MLIPFGVFSAGVSTAVPGSYDLISTAYGTGSSSSITFSSLPTGYKHLQLRVTARTSSGTTSGTDFMYFIFNGDTSSSYAYHYLHGNGGSMFSANGTSLSAGYSTIAAGNSSTTNSYAGSIIDILDYQGSKNKTVRALTGAHMSSATQVYLWSTLWANTSAITSFSINAFNNFSSASRFSLYGLKGE